MEGGPFIEVTVEDDLLITAAEGLPTMPSSGCLGNCDEYISGGLETNVHQKEHLSKICKQAEQISELSESLEQKSSKSRNADSRKSLAWDSEFFTSEGILDAEELAIVNGTFAKAEARKLPRIHEDASKPTESISKLDSESLDLESLEVDLFQDLRASIQKSLGKCDKASYDGREQGGLNESHFGLSKKNETSSKTNKLKPNNTLRRHVPSTQHADDTSKEAMIRVKKDTSGIRVTKSLLHRATTLPAMPGKKSSVTGSIQTKGNNGKSLPGSRIGNSANQSQGLASKGRVNHSRSFAHNSSTEKDASDTGTLKSSLKPRVIGSSAATLPSMPGRRASDTRSIQTKSNAAKPMSGNAGKKPSVASLKISGDLSSATLRSTPSLKSTLGTQLINGASSSSSSSDHSHKSLESLSVRTSHHPSEPTTKTITRRSRSQNGSNDSDGSPTRPMIKRSSSVSSNSSLGSVVTRSSSSTSISVVKPYKISTNLRHSRNEQDPSTSGSENHTRNFTPSTTGAKCFKPSGLKMPTPKIGFFDAEKSTIHSSSQFSHPGLCNPPPKNTGNTNAIGAKKLKPSTLPSLRSAALRALNTSATKPPTSVSLHTLPKPAELQDPPTLTKDNALCSRVELDLSPNAREDHHLENPTKGICVMNEFSRLTNLGEEKASYSNFKHSAPRVIEKEKLCGIDSSSDFVELICQGISSMSLSGKKNSAITGDL